MIGTRTMQAGMLLAVAGALVALSYFVTQQTVFASSAAGGETAVTIDDLDASTQAFAACLEDAGLVVHEFPGEQLRPARVSVEIPANGPDDTAALDAGRRLVDDCNAAGHSNVVAAWSAQSTEPDAATVEDLIIWLETCVNEGGAPEQVVPPVETLVIYRNATRSPDIRPEDRQLYRECAVRVEAETGLLAPQLSGE